MTRKSGSRPRLMRLARRIGIAVAAVVACLALVAVLGMYWAVKRAEPTYSGELTLPGLM